MRIIIISILLFGFLRVSLTQTMGRINLTSHEVKQNNKTEFKIDSLKFIIINLRTRDTLFNDNFRLEFSKYVETGSYKIIANYKNFPQIIENFFVVDSKITFLALKFKVPKTLRGNYLMINQFSISYFKFKKNNVVKWYTKGCTNNGTEHFGTWSQKEDTVFVNINNEKKAFKLIDNTLFLIDDEADLTEMKYGIKKTNIQSKYRVRMKAKKQRNL